MNAPDEKFDPLDQRISEAVRGIPIPSGLRARLVQRLEEERRPTASAAGWLGPILAVAAAVLLAFAGSELFPETKPRPTSFPAEVAQFLEDGFRLDVVSSNLEEIEAWLRSEAGHEELDLPARLAKLKAVGCRRVEIDGRSGSLVCFRMPNGRVAHFFTFLGPAPEGLSKRSGLTVRRYGNWSGAAWSENGVNHVLMVPGSPDLTRSLLNSA